MGKVPKDEMTTLRTAAESKETATTAEATTQLEQVAFAINQAANCGEYEVSCNTNLLDEVKSELTSKGYKLRYVFDAETRIPNAPLIISWK